MIWVHRNMNPTAQHMLSKRKLATET